MAKTTFSTDNIKRSGTDFPRVKLAQGETWRIVIIEQEPTYAWTHRMVKPKFSPVTGRMQMKTIERKSGEKVSVPDLDFVGSPVCLGNLDVLNEKGLDPDHCPICKEYQNSPEQFSAPERRFAVHVLKYSTKAGTSQLANPFSVETRVWVMSENRFSQVTQKIAEWGGDPTKVDFVLGPCINAGFQNYEIAVGQSCEMRASAERMQRAAETFKENNAGDLEPYCGRVAELRWVRNDIDEIKAAWRKAAGGSAEPAPVDTTDTLDTSLLDSVSGGTKAPAADAPTADLSQLDDTVGVTVEEPAPARTEPAPAKASAPASNGSGADLDFDSLLDNI